MNIWICDNLRSFAAQLFMYFSLINYKFKNVDKISLDFKNQLAVDKIYFIVKELKEWITSNLFYVANNMNCATFFEIYICAKFAILWKMYLL